MKYEKAQDILPQDILQAIQQYIDGGYLYIPRKSENKKSWGEDSGAVRDLENRNQEIYSKYKDGLTVKELSVLYFLSEASIRRVIRLYR